MTDLLWQKHGPTTDAFSLIALKAASPQFLSKQQPPAYFEAWKATEPWLTLLVQVIGFPEKFIALFMLYLVLFGSKKLMSAEFGHYYPT